MSKKQSLFLIVAIILFLGSGCTSRQTQDSLVGSTAQRLVTHSIDDLTAQLPDEDFRPLAGQKLFIASHFIERMEMKDYAEKRLAVELQHRFNIKPVTDPEMADYTLNVFYTSLGTDQGSHGFFIPLGFIPGVADQTRVNLITLEQFHGVSEMYYYLGVTGTERRSAVMSARVRTDALGLPIITVPISNMERDQ